MDNRPKFKTQTYNTPWETTEENLGGLGLGDDVLVLYQKHEPPGWFEII